MRIPRVYLTTVGLTGGGALLAIGAVMLVAALTFCLTPELRLYTDGYFWQVMWAGVVTSLLGLVFLIVGGLALSNTNLPSDPKEACLVQYRGYLVGIGYALLLLAALTLVALAGLAFGGNLQTVFPLSTPKAGLGVSAQSSSIVILLIVSLVMSLLGALFFVANALREKRDDFVEFDAALFWGGLWYRLGEAVLFTVVFFLSIRRFSSDENGAYWLPILALLIGMFVKSGERLVFGLAKRVFAAVATMVPVGGSDLRDERLDESVPPAAARDLKELAHTDDSVTLQWSAPDGAARAVAYKVERKDAAAAHWQLADVSAALSSTIRNLTPGVYQFRVTPLNPSGDGVPSAALQVAI